MRPPEHSPSPQMPQPHPFHTAEGPLEQHSPTAADYLDLARHVVATCGLPNPGEQRASWQGGKRGVLMDVRSEQPFVAANLARLTDLDFILLNPEAEALEHAAHAMRNACADQRSTYLQASEQAIPLDDESVDWAISCFSVGMWENPQGGIEECMRVLKTGGCLYITGIERNSYRDYFGMLKAARFERFRISNDGDCMWIDIWKTPARDDTFPFGKKGMWTPNAGRKNA